MEATEFESLPESDEFDRVLAAYFSEASVQKTLDPEHDGWVARIRNVEGVPDEELSALHGWLIAHGLLKIELAGREEGMRYRLSGTGKEQLARGESELTQSGNTNPTRQRGNRTRPHKPEAQAKT